jgi:membrane-associated phospholipid phosphatase
LTPEIDSVNSFDNFVMSLMAEYSQKSVALNKIIVQLFDYYTIKIVPVFFCVWLLWFGSKAEKYRPAIVRALLGMLFAVFVSRSIQDFLPERLRPLNAGDPHFIPPLGVHIDEMEHWSSFPSDHAALFFAFSTALWLTSRTFGALGYAWSVFIICIPRIYSGRHYASDVVAGAAIGVAVTLLLARPISTKVMPWVRLAEERYKALFYASFFVISYQFCTMFDDIRHIGSALKKFFSVTS